VTEATARALLAGAGISASEPLVLLTSNWSNEVWMSERHVLRIASRRGPTSLAHELAIAAELPASVPLYQAWVDAEPGAEDELIDALARSMRALHAVDLPPELGAPAPWTDGLPPAGGPPVEATAMPDLIRDFVIDARTAAAMPGPTGDRILELLDRIEDALSSEPARTVHTDLGFDNAMWDGEQVWLLDLEWCCTAPADYELVHILRYCHQPETAVEPAWRDKVAGKDHARIPVALEQSYPELFSHPRLTERLLVYGLAGFARGWHWRPDLWRTDVEHEQHPSRSLLGFLNGGHWLRSLP
jgi:hypothetical protein